MNKTALRQFEQELRIFFSVLLLNLVCGALILALSLMSILSSLKQEENISLVMVVAGLAGAGIGIWWIRTSARILAPVQKLRRERQSRHEPVSEDILTGWIVRMMTQYRENRQFIRWMVPIGLLCGLIYLALGVTNALQGVASISGDLLPFGMEALFAAGLNTVIGVTCLLVSLWFLRYARAWNLRLAEITRSEALLQQMIETE